MNKKVIMQVMVLLIAFFALAPQHTLWATRIMPPYPHERAISDYASCIEVGQPSVYKHLALYPIMAEGARTPAIDLSLTKAMAQGLVEVTELSSAEVNRARIRNLCKRPIFIMAGEMLRGGKQDRIVADDLILPAYEELTIPVFCVEHGRWEGREAGFRTGHSLAGAAIRGAGGRAGQSGVWSKVEEQQRSLRAPSATGALRSVHDSVEVRERMEPYIKALSDLPADNPKMRGVVVAVDGDIMVADLFGSTTLLRQMWPDLLESYVIDALERIESRPARRESRASTVLRPSLVQEWLDGIKRAKRTEKETPGDGKLYELRGAGVMGNALVFQGAVVHMGLFRAFFAAEPEHNRLRFRREQMERRGR